MILNTNTKGNFKYLINTVCISLSDMIKSTNTTLIIKICIAAICMFVVVFKLYEIKHKTLYFPTKFESPFFLPRMVWFVTLITL